MYNIFIYGVKIQVAKLQDLDNFDKIIKFYLCMYNIQFVKFA